MGALQFELFASCPVAINRMFAMFHAQFPKLEQNHTVRGPCCWCIKTAAFICDCSIWYWFDVPNIHICVPHTMKSV